MLLFIDEVSSLTLVENLVDMATEKNPKPKEKLS